MNNFELGQMGLSDWDVGLNLGTERDSRYMCFRTSKLYHKAHEDKVKFTMNIPVAQIKNIQEENVRYIHRVSDYYRYWWEWRSIVVIFS